MKNAINYNLFGITICSEIQLPSVMRGSIGADAYIRYGKVPSQLKQAKIVYPNIQMNETQFLYDLGKSGRFLVQNGQEIIVEATEEINGIQLGLFLLESVVLGALLQQRGYLLLHACAITDGNSAIVFLGKSGSGKSTTAAAFLERGYKLLTDDICAIKFDENSMAYVYPSFPQQRLQLDTLRYLHKRTDYKQYPQTEKYLVPVDSVFHTKAVSLEEIYILETSEQPQLTITGLSKLERIPYFYQHLAFPQFVTYKNEEYLRQFASLAGKISTHKISRALQNQMLDDLLEIVILRHKAVNLLSK